MNAKIIKTEAEYEAIMTRIEELMDATPNSSEEQELELLVLFVEKYEHEHYPIDLPDPVEAIKFRMEQEELTPKDLIPYIGSQSKVSEVLNYKRPLSISMIRALNKGLGIPAEVLLKESNTDPNEISSGWEKSLFKELFKRGYFTGFTGTLNEAKAMADDLFRNLFSVFGDMQFHQVYCKKGDREINPNALMSWQAKVLSLVMEEKLPPFIQDNISTEFIKQVIGLSYYSKGPQMAVELLKKNGIYFTVLSHLPNTYLDGACFHAPNGCPVIGLTLRHDRLDNFWFTLIHELAHLYLHLNGKQIAFFDDTDVPLDDQTHPEEQQANEFARDMFIPREIWGEISCELVQTEDEQLLINVAERLKIHPAIVAGRVRRETQDYRRFTSLVGHGQVRPQFPEYN